MVSKKSSMIHPDGFAIECLKIHIAIGRRKDGDLFS